MLKAWGCLLQVEPKVQKLYDYIRERGTILPINDYNKELLMQDDVHKRVAESIRSGEFYAHSIVTAASQCRISQHLPLRLPGMHCVCDFSSDSPTCCADIWRILSW